MPSITFALPAGSQTISFLSPLPALTHGIIIDPTTLPGFSGTPLLTIDGSSAGANGLTPSSNNSIIRGLNITNFGGSGIAITAGNNNSLTSNTISNNGGDGISVAAGTGNLLTGNSIFNNGGLGIDLGPDGPTTMTPPMPAPTICKTHRFSRR